MIKYSIGPFIFASLTGPPPGPTENISVWARAGADGQTVIKTGRRAGPIRVVSFVNCASAVAGWSLLRSYERMVGAAPVNIQWAGRFEGEWLVQILGVQPVPGGIRTISIGVGGIGLSPSYGICRCQWELLPVEMV